MLIDNEQPRHAVQIRVLSWTFYEMSLENKIKIQLSPYFRCILVATLEMAVFRLSKQLLLDASNYENRSRGQQQYRLTTHTTKPGKEVTKT